MAAQRPTADALLARIKEKARPRLRIYIGAAPGCPRNDVYRATMLDRFVRGASPVDFPADDFEVDFAGRATVDDLNDTGRAQFGLA